MGEFKWQTMHGTFELPRPKRQVKAPATSVSLVGKLSIDSEGGGYTLDARSGTSYKLKENLVSRKDMAPLTGQDVRVRGLFSLSDMTIVVESLEKNKSVARIWPPKVR